MTDPKPVLRYCDECRWFDFYVVCRKGLKPRFQGPRSPMDQRWGFKRKCDQFTAADEREATA